MIPRSIVVPLDGSAFAERALPVARALAARVDGNIVLLTTRWDSEFAEADDYLERIAGQPSDIPTEVLLILDRDAAEAIAMVARDDAERLVCMTSHGRGGLRWAVLGSIAEQVVRESHHPLFLVGPHCSPEWPASFDRIVACVGAFDVADPIVPVATEWAKALGLAVEVAHVIHPLDVEQESHADKVLAAIVANLESDGVRAKSVVLRRSFVPGALADYAGEPAGTVLMITSHTRTGIARVALGSVAMGTLALAPCPVLVAPTI